MPNTHQKKVEVVMLISDEIDFGTKKLSETEQDVRQCYKGQLTEDT